MPLFDKIEREDRRPAPYGEPKFSFLNRSGRSDVARIRELMEEWFSHYPEANMDDLRGRFRSQNDNNHYSGFFELLLYQLCLRLGCDIEIHPALPNTARRPDFKVECPDGTQFYLEAVAVSGESNSEAAANAMKHTVYDALNRMTSPNFFIGINRIYAGAQQPSARRMRTFLEQNLEGLNADELEQQLRRDGLNSLPHWLYEGDGWRITFFPYPKSTRLRGQPGVRPIGMLFDGGGWIDNRTPIKDALLGKGQAYGQLDLPYVIALNALADLVDRIDVMEALFGREQFLYNTSRPKQSPEFQRAPDGVWTSHDGPRYKRISGVFFTFQLMPWTIGRAQSCLYHNPWGTLPYNGCLNRLPIARAGANNNMEWQEGESLGQIFELPDGWPGD